MLLAVHSVQIGLSCATLITVFIQFNMTASWKPIWSFYLQLSTHPLHPVLLWHTVNWAIIYCANGLLIKYLSQIFRDKDFSHQLLHWFSSDWDIMMNPKHTLITMSFSWLLRKLKTHLSLVCIVLLRSTAGFQTFAQVQTVTTEAINVVMSIWHQKCYFLQGLSHILENIRSKQNWLCPFSIPK